MIFAIIHNRKNVVDFITAEEKDRDVINASVPDGHWVMPLSEDSIIFYLKKYAQIKAIVDGKAG